MKKQVKENHSAGLHMNQSEINYAHPLAFDIYPTGPFLFSLKLYFFPTTPTPPFFKEKMNGHNPLVQISARLNYCVCLF